MKSTKKTDLSIETGLGNIDFIKPDNLQLQELMENFEEALSKHGAKKLSDILQALK
jgi:hypothetical protein